MNAERAFVDTNILLYAFDRREGQRHVRAKALLAELWNGSEPPFISIQVLQEFYVNLLKKGISATEARDAVRVHLTWPLVPNDKSLLLLGIDVALRWQLSLCDGLIIAAARQAGAAVVWSEDLNHGQDYGGVRVLNPFV